MAGTEVMPWVTGNPEDLAEIATGRAADLFAGDLASADGRLREALASRRILVIGGAGSIGAATVLRLADYGPAGIDIVDLNENGLAEIVRFLRNRPAGLAGVAMRFLPLDFGNPIMRRLLEETPPYDAILNFAAVKHVRSEKDVFSLLQMVDTNVVKVARFLEWLAERDFAGRYFGVSTDKAANPVNLMGASKRLMEHVMFSGEAPVGLTAGVTSARFANVAFSDGSLLHSFMNRLAKRQPLAAPRAIERFFISTSEAAAICLVSAFVAPQGVTVVPKTNDTVLGLRKVEDVAAAFLRRFGLEPVTYADEGLARERVEEDLRRRAYPLLLTEPDTTGEKPFEEFVSDEETARDIGFGRLAAVDYVAAPAGTVATAVAKLAALVGGRHPVTKQDIVHILAGPIPLLRHAETGRNLDDRM